MSSLVRGAGAPEAGLGAWGQGGQGQPDTHTAARALAVPSSWTHAFPWLPAAPPRWAAVQGAGRAGRPSAEELT